MLTNSPFNFLVWETPVNLPLPKEIIPLISAKPNKDNPWAIRGLPLSEAKYSINSKGELYLDELSDGQPKVCLMDNFTGSTLVSNYFQNEDIEGYNYFVTMMVTFVNGLVIDIKVHEIKKQYVQDYKQAFSQFEKELMSALKRNTSWWYRFIYYPYSLVIKGLTVFLVAVLRLLQVCIYKIAKILTPI